MAEANGLGINGQNAQKQAEVPEAAPVAAVEQPQAPTVTAEVPEAPRTDVPAAPVKVPENGTATTPPKEENIKGQNSSDTSTPTEIGETRGTPLQEAYKRLLAATEPLVHSGRVLSSEEQRVVLQAVRDFENAVSIGQQQVPETPNVR